jgi:Flp pilus assembly pilin Flp
MIKIALHLYVVFGIAAVAIGVMTTAGVSIDTPFTAIANALAASPIGVH